MVTVEGARVVICKNAYDSSPPFDTVFAGQTGTIHMLAAPGDPNGCCFIRLDSGYISEATGSAIWPFYESEFEVVGA